MTALRDYRFPVDMLETKPGPHGKTLTFVDVRNIAAALDKLAPGWSSDIHLFHTDTEYAATCAIAIDGITRSDTGSGPTPPDASNQAFRRCAAAHGLGAYLWTGEPEPPLWASKADAQQWALDVGAFKSRQHMENAYRLVKRVGRPSGAASMFTLWKSEVEHRCAEKAAQNGHVREEVPV